MFKIGDWVIYRLTKHSNRPGPRAKDVRPHATGDSYGYVVDKFWIVADVEEEGRLLLRTRTGKERIVDADDSNLRAPRIWERIIYRSRFPSIDPPPDRGPDSSNTGQNDEMAEQSES